ncbi:Radical SAM superfamily protein [Thermoactinomyces sp. DSM 45891]|uniref:SPL family radical SAM protein n=1 Tax=Thermoactinomyces sp. DSM 45891 TaxID=1761907 RepID=UPI00091DC2C4|nr:radical SAM protein [Thermoactinomyces sp. DSM 45891]SFX61592.1 Radical SAM superfamily protein [Thermoactinomyces sp. DSM 45891]
MVEFKEITSRTILTLANGSMDGSRFTFTLNPYVGCVFGCKYCYVREMPAAKYREAEWGEYVDIKTNAAQLLEKEIQKARKKGTSVSIFMSTATDPYQGVEAKTGLTRSLLEAMLSQKNEIDYLMIHTRSPLAKRDIDLFLEFEQKIIVSMTIETDLEKVRKVFTPSAPPIPARLATLREITEAGVPTRASISPMLPLSKHIARTLRGVTNHVALDDFFMGDGSRGRRTERMNIKKLYEQLNLLQWFERGAYKKVLVLLKEEFGEVDVFNEI